MNEGREERSETLRWVFSMPPVPRPVLIGLCALWWAYFGVGIYLEDSATPHQAWWLDIWHGGLGGNGFSAFGATVLGIILTVEVGIIVFTLAGNRRRIKEAAERATREAAEKAAVESQKAAEKAAQEAEKRVRREWEEWYEQVGADLAAGRPPSVPPPSDRNGTAT